MCRPKLGQSPDAVCRRHWRLAGRVAPAGIAPRRARLAGQILDPVSQILLAGDQLSCRKIGGIDSSPRQEIVHAARSHPLARLERGHRPTAQMFDEGQAEVDIPLVGQIAGPRAFGRGAAGNRLDVLYR